MKFSRTPAVLATVALVAASTLFVVSPAAAADNYYDSTDFAQQTTPGTYPMGDWFYGYVAAGAGDVDWSVAGIEFNNGTNPSGIAQILSTPGGGTPGPIGWLAALVDGAHVADDNGDWRFQVTLNAYGAAPVGTIFTTLSPQALGDFDSTDTWVTSDPIPDAAGTGYAYAAGATATLVQFEAALNALPAPLPYEVLAFGLYFTAAETDTIHAIRWDGDWNIFTPQAAAAVSPTTLQVSAFTDPAKGVTATASGFLPGEDVYWQVEDPNGTFVFLPDGVADAAGTSSTTFVAPGAPTPALGTYRISAYSDYIFAFDTSFVEAAFEVTATILPPTGLDLSGAGMLAGILLITGLGVVLVRRRVDSRR